MQIVGRIRATGALAALALAASAPAANMVPDPEFDTGIGNWSVGDGASLTLDPDMGSPTAPSAHFVSNVRAGMWLPCIQIGAQNVDGRANVKVVSGEYLSFNLWAFSTTDCSSALLGHGEIFAFVFPSDTWATVGGTRTLPTGTQSVLIDLSFSNSANVGGEAYIDHVQFGPEGTAPVTLQSFEVN